MTLSVCVPVYNAEASIERCARSLLSQRGVDIECIFIDDGSADGSVVSLERVLGELDPQRMRSKVIRFPQNRGRVAARFTALEAATGDYVGFCDADDWVESDCYAKLVAAVGRKDADAAVCAYVDVSANGSKSSPRCVAAYEPDPREFVVKSFYSPGFNSLCNKIFRTSIARRWFADGMPDLCVGEDLLMTMRFFSRAKRLAFVDEALYCYRKTDRSVSRELSRRTISDMVACVRLLEKEFCFLPKRSLDVMRVHALWAACRCRDFTNDEVRDLAREFAIDFASVGPVPSVKRRVLASAASCIPALRFAVRGIETVRGLLA